METNDSEILKPENILKELDQLAFQNQDQKDQVDSSYDKEADAGRTAHVEDEESLDNPSEDSDFGTFMNDLKIKTKKSEETGSGHRRTSRIDQTEKSSPLLLEMQQYLKLELLQNDDGPVQWWRANAKKFPSFSRMAVKDLASPPSSNESEKQFSIGGNIYTNKRSRLLPENGEMLPFLNKIIVYCNSTS